MKQIFPALILLLMLGSCAKSEEEKVDSAKQQAKYYLTSGDCSDARDVLEEAGYQSDDAVYIGLLADTYACDAGFSQIALITNSELENIASGADQMLGSLTVLPTSNETAPDSDSYTNLMSAIDTIISSGGGRAAGRQTEFGSIGGTNLNFQALLLIMVELGKFMELYGDTAAGVKGGKGNHTCIYSYTVGDAITYVSGSPDTGSCSGGGDGSPYLPNPTTDPTTKARLCEGIYLFNNLRDILANSDFGTSATFSSIKDISANVEAALDTAEGLDGRIGTVRDVYSKEACDVLTVDELEVWYAYIFETALP